MQNPTLLKVLNEISDQTILNIDYCNNNGLCDGRMGSILFLYLYSELQDNETLFDLCNELLLQTLDKLNDKETSYSSGLPGIADVLEYLNQEDFLDIPNRDDFFTNVNTEIQRNYTGPGIEFESLQTTLYLLSGINGSSLDNIKDIGLLMNIERAVEHVDFIEKDLINLKTTSYEEFAVTMKSSTDIIRTIIILKKLALSINFLKELQERSLYTAVVSILIEEAYKKNNNLINHIYRFMEENIPDMDHFAQLHLLISSFNIHNFRSTPDEKKQFENCIIQHFEKALQTDVNFSKNSIRIHIGSLFQLMQINDSLSSISLRDITSAYLNAILNNFKNKSIWKEVNGFLNSDSKFGTGGPAGLGIIIIMYLSNKTLNCKNILSNLNTL